jgi:hypothetical protein
MSILDFGLAILDGQPSISGLLAISFVVPLIWLCCTPHTVPRQSHDRWQMMLKVNVFYRPE